MLELTFSQSAGGGLKIAKSRETGRDIGGTLAAISGKSKDRSAVMQEENKKGWTGVSLGSESGDVACLTLALDIGELSDMDGDMGGRKAMLQTLYGDYPGVPQQIWKENEEAFARLDETAKSGKPVRLWVFGDDPGERCGLCYVCHRLQGASLPIILVDIPSLMAREEIVYQFRGGGDVPLEGYGALARDYGRQLTPAERTFYVRQWQSLVEQNAPLRAVINGRLQGVEETFYDFALRANFPDRDFIAAQAIGKTLGQVAGVSDRWLFLRMERMLSSGELIEVKPANDDQPYSALLRRGASAVDEDV